MIHYTFDFSICFTAIFKVLASEARLIFQDFHTVHLPVFLVTRGRISKSTSMPNGSSLRHTERWNLWRKPRNREYKPAQVSESCQKRFFYQLHSNRTGLRWRGQIRHSENIHRSQRPFQTRKSQNPKSFSFYPLELYRPAKFTEGEEDMKS